ncbi:MAG: ClpX C4-type zinc finger protein [Myxococcota bacterium]
MPDDAKEYVRAAQEAEIQGDKARAVDLLKKAAALYRNAGNSNRALKMLRHARTLDGTRQDLTDELRRLEWLPENPLARAVSGEDEATEALEQLEKISISEPKLIERGPTRADPTLPAWCSFCCRPRGEVGDLVAGPAGAFICRGCVEESRALLGEGRPVAPPMSDEAPAVEPLGQTEAQKVLDTAFRMGAQLVLVLGPEGTGKTTLLRDLARRGLGRYLTDLERSLPLPDEDGQRLLLDVPAVSVEHGNRLAELLRARPDRQLVIAFRGEPKAPSFVLQGDEIDLPMYSGRALHEATGGKLPLALADRVQVVAQLSPLSVESLAEIARRLLARRAAELDVSDELVTTLAEEAARAARGARELEALVERLPPGSWNLSAKGPLDSARDKPKTRRRRKKSAPPKD